MLAHLRPPRVLHALATLLVAWQATSCGGVTPPDPGGSAATRLGFSVQPSNAVSGTAINPAVAVSLLDANGQVVPTATGSVTIAIAAGTGPAGAQLTGSLTASAVNGVAVFTNLVLDKAGAGYQLQASSSGLTGTTSTAFAVQPGAPSRLAFTTQPTNAVSGAAIAPAVQVAVTDAAGNVVATASNTISLSLTGGAAGATLGGTAVANAASGIAAFAGLTVDKAGTGYQLAAASPGLTGISSSAFAITPGAASRLAITTQPASTTAGQPISLAATITDAAGNVVTSATGAVTVAIAAGTGTAGATLGGTTTVTPAAGVVTFTGLTIDRPGTGYRLALTGAGLTTATSNTFDIAVGAAAALRFSAQPASMTSQAAATFTVEIVDALGNVVPTATGSVTLAIAAGTGTAGAALGGTVTRNAVAGVVTFGDITIDKAGTSYRVAATSGALTAATSNPFDVLAGAAAQLEFASAPSSMVSLAPATFSVRILDAAGNPVPGATNVVTLAITATTGAAGATLGGTVSRTASAGVATFNDITLDKVATDYRLTASSGGLSAVTTGQIAVAHGAAASLHFTAQPTTMTSGQAASFSVQVRDAAGNVVTGGTTPVTLALVSGTGTAGATLGGTLTRNASGGVAVFNDVTIDRSGTGYQVRATSTGLTSATSAGINVTTGPAVRLEFTTVPAQLTSMTAGTFTVAVVDAAGNTVTTATHSITVSIAAGTGTAGATLGGTRTRSAVNGVATFSGLTVDKAGTGYRLAASTTGLTSATSATFDVVVGAATRLEFTTQQAVMTSGVADTFAVRVVDAGGNTVTSSTASITIAIAAGTGTAGATLGGTKTKNASAGVASFNAVSIDKAGTGYRLTATATGLTTATSNAFTVTHGAATRLAFTTAPTAMTSMVPATFAVTVLDAAGNTVTSASNAVTLAIASGTGAAGASLGGTLTQNAVSGVATFNGLTIDKAATGYRLAASATGLTGANTAAFAVAVGAASRLEFTAQPTTMTAGTAGSFTVRVSDAGGNTVTAATNAITLSITSGTGTPGAVLGGTLTRNAVNGVAAFTGITVDRAGSGYRLTASAAGLAGATTATFTVTAPPSVMFTVEPSSAVAGVAIAPAIRVALVDGLGNVATTGTGTVTLSIQQGTGAVGAELVGTYSLSAVNGVATFPNVAIRRAAAGYRLIASSPDWAGTLTDTSAAFTITHAAASQLQFTTTPASIAAGQASTFAVGYFDDFSNPVTSATGPVTVAIAPGTGVSGATLGGVLTRTPSGGIATFPDLAITKAGAGYRLAASASGLATVQSTQFTVTPGAATRLAFTVQPTSTNARTALSPAVRVTLYDTYDNVASGSSVAVTMAIAAGTGASGAVLGGTTVVPTTAGVATFSNLTVDLAATGYRLAASASGLTTQQSNAFDIGTGVSVGLARLDVTPATATVAVNGTVPLTATLVDANGNTSTATPVWASSNPGIATVSASGVVTALRTGTVTITATQAGLVGRATITITP